MRYITALFGSVFIFVAINVICFVINAQLPPTFQRPITIPLLLSGFSATPALLVGMVIGIAAATHSFRSTLHRYTVKAERPACQSD
jgi:hypothetical protein